jgi:ArsR family metal-binding transcriptional regulator
MPVNDEERIKILADTVHEMALVGYRLDKLLEGFKLYHESKNTMDISRYEMLNKMYEDGLVAMESLMGRYHRLFSYIETMTKEGGK